MPHKEHSLIVCVAGLVLLWWVLCNHLFVCFGDPFCRVLLPLINHRQFLYYLSSIGESFLNGLLFAHSLLLVLAIKEHSLKVAFFSLLCCVPFAIGFIIAEPPGDYNYQEEVSIIAPRCLSQSPLECAQELCEALIASIALNPKSSLLIMPESSFPFALNEHPEIIKLLSENVPLDNRLLLLGTHLRINNNLYNSLCVIHECRIIYHYEKTLLIPFFEYTPTTTAPSPCPRTHPHHEEFTQGKTGRAFTHKSLSCYPRICAEFFFSNQEPPGKIPLLILVKELCLAAQFRHVLLRMAQFRALEWKRECIYASHSKGCIISKKGDQLIHFY